MHDSPSVNGDNGPTVSNGDNGGRGPDGRFRPGCKGGPGNPNLRRTAQFMAELRAGVTAEDFAEIVTVLVTKAKAGESWAIREVLDRLCGRPLPAPAEPWSLRNSLAELMND